MNRKFEHDEIHFDLLWAISYISDQGKVGRELVIQNQLHRHGFMVLSQAFNPDFNPNPFTFNKSFFCVNNRLITPSLRTLGNLCSGNDSETQVVINLGCIPIVIKIMNSKNTT